ncbi:hypothetical protein IWW36_004293, partial [Coemansia brasiliensis]
MAGAIRQKAITDRMAQYLASTCIIPALEYYAAGVPITTEQITQISKPIMKMVKHAHGVPTTLPDTYFHLRQGARIPNLKTRIQGRNT